MTDSDLKAAGFERHPAGWKLPTPMDYTVYMSRNECEAIETFARARISAALRPLVEAGKALEEARHPERCHFIDDINERKWESEMCTCGLASLRSALADAERRLTLLD